MVLTVSFVVSPETGLCCLRRPWEALASWELDTSVGVSERYDFAVRLVARSSCAPRASIASRTPRSWRRVTPLLMSAGRQLLYCCFYPTKKRNIFRQRAGQDGQIRSMRIYQQRHARMFKRLRCRRATIGYYSVFERSVGRFAWRKRVKI